MLSIFNVFSSLPPHKLAKPFSLSHETGADSKGKGVTSYWNRVEPSSLCSFMYSIIVVSLQTTKPLSWREGAAWMKRGCEGERQRRPAARWWKANGRPQVEVGMLCEVTGGAGSVCSVGDRFAFVGGNRTWSERRGRSAPGSAVKRVSLRGHWVQSAPLEKEAQHGFLIFRLRRSAFDSTLWKASLLS